MFATAPVALVASLIAVKWKGFGLISVSALALSTLEILLVSVMVASLFLF